MDSQTLGELSDVKLITDEKNLELFTARLGFKKDHVIKVFQKLQEVHAERVIQFGILSKTKVEQVRTLGELNRDLIQSKAINLEQIFDDLDSPQKVQQPPGNYSPAAISIHFKNSSTTPDFPELPPRVTLSPAKSFQKSTTLKLDNTINTLLIAQSPRRGSRDSPGSR